MGKISEVVGKLYQKYQPIASAAQVQLNLDIRDDSNIDDESEVSQNLEKQLDSAIKRTKQGKINISIRNKEIIISDTGTILSKPICELLSNSHTEVKSRLGFGTKVKISLDKKDKNK